MFTKTRKRIYRTLTIIAAILVVSMIVPTVWMFSGMFFHTYQSMASNKLDRSISAARIYIDSIMSTTENLALNPALTEALTNDDGDPLTDVLDATRSYSQYINALTVYDTDGRIFTSSGTINPPTLDELRLNGGIAAFFADGEAEEYLSLRTSAMCSAYDNSPYDSRAGIISCCKKVYGPAGVEGYIFADLFPKNLFDYFTYSDDSRLSGSIAVIKFDGGYLASGDMDGMQTFLNAQGGSVSGGRLTITAMRNFYGCTLRLSVPLSPVYSTIAVIAAILVSTGGILLYAAHLVAGAVARSVTSRLNCLLIKMSMSEQRFL